MDDKELLYTVQMNISKHSNLNFPIRHIIIVNGSPSFLFFINPKQKDFLPPFLKMNLMSTCHVVNTVPSSG